MPSDVLNNLVNHLPCGVFTFFDDGAIHFISDPLLHKLGYTLDELTGKSVESIFTLSTRIFYQTHFYPLLKLHGHAEEIFITLLSKNKEQVPVLVNAVKKDADGVNLHVCASFSVEQRQKYEQEILSAKRVAEDAIKKNDALQKVEAELQAERELLDQQITRLKYRNEELSQLSNLFTHDLQEPVRKVSVFSDVIMNEKNMLNSAHATSLFEIVFRSSQRMRKLLRGMQEYLTLSVENVQKTSVDLSEIISQQVQILQQSCCNINLMLEVKQLPIVPGNSKQLTILFKELLSNCFQFRRGDDLTIKISYDEISENIFNNIEGKYKYGAFAKIEIEDNGIGFNSETSEHIFKILKKVSLTTEGLGMGLALCKKIVENHGGRISAWGKEGAGAKFAVTLPLS